MKRERVTTPLVDGGDWLSHAYKTTTCAQSRHWAPVHDTPPQR